MAGNVKEWTVNPTGDLHYLLGGAWNEDDYVFSGSDARPPFAREATFGFRCVRRLTPPAEETFKAVTLQDSFSRTWRPSTIKRSVDSWISMPMRNRISMPESSASTHRHRTGAGRP